MSVGYRAIQWNRQKKVYDWTLGLGLLLLWAGFAAGTFFLFPATTPETFLIRGTALSALLLLHVILCIGPLARLDPRVAPLLYNRRHLGVMLFVFALAHGLLTTFQFHAFGDENPLVSVVTAYAHDATSWTHHFREISQFPFEWFGIGALLIFFLMAATSHDFWLKNLGASFWKLMHMMVYVAYGLVVLHVMYGAVQDRQSPMLATMMALGFGVVCALHVASGWIEWKRGRRASALLEDGWIDAVALSELAENRGRLIQAAGQRFAVYRVAEAAYALSNVCRHQGGPISEGRLIDGCVTCPWHGWQYRPETGISPPPFEEALPAFPTRIENGRVWIKPEAKRAAGGNA